MKFYKSLCLKYIILFIFCRDECTISRDEDPHTTGMEVDDGASSDHTEGNDIEDEQTEIQATPPSALPRSSSSDAPSPSSTSEPTNIPISPARIGKQCQSGVKLPPSEAACNA